MFHKHNSSFDQIHVSKQYSPNGDAAFCGVLTGVILFADVPKNYARLRFKPVNVNS